MSGKYEHTNNETNVNKVTSFLKELFTSVSTVTRLDQILEYMQLYINGEDPVHLRFDNLPPIYPVAYFPTYKFEIDFQTLSKFIPFKFKWVQYASNIF